ncbi:HIRAN domain-containing protein [Stutzerimonas nitrititolerans]|uniref:HIRAN domain-containing protein n=1 Tax=Stutzerimonas nitrititolerans TaxID=2482751 RepID=UPI0028B0D1B4|nr:HIRAN domain-containing protein [Stutzerimonas nitrititolerans]
MTEHNTVYLAWQAPEARDWHVVGALIEHSDKYVFHYTQGAIRADNFVPFSGMEDLRKSYISRELFPLFQNRLLSHRRPEYPSFLKWLGLSTAEATPANILARSGGTRGTDQLQVFKRVEIDPTGHYKHFFFLHGLGYLSSSAQERVDSLKSGEELALCLDNQNSHDSSAVIVRAKNPAEIIGYCPRYLSKDVRKLLEKPNVLRASIESISADAPKNYRVMCKIEGNAHNLIFDQEDYMFTD